MIKELLKRKLPIAKEFFKIVKSGQQPRFIDYILFKLGMRSVYWPHHSTCILANKKNIFVGINCLIGRPGNYLQGKAGIYIGDYVQLAPNVGILSSNHDLYDQRLSRDEKVVIGSYSWVGMNSVILPGVTLGTRTIVAAGSVVTKSFPDGFCVVAGVPAKIIKELDRELFKPWADEYEYYGFVEKAAFENKYPEIFKRLRENLARQI